MIKPDQNSFITKKRFLTLVYITSLSLILRKYLGLCLFFHLLKNNCIAVKSSLNKLYLICHDKSPYTAAYTLTHKTKTQEKIIYRPDIRFKIYFDAKLLEVISICKDTRINNSHPLLDNCSDLAFQFELNLFMLRWLDYCLDRYNGAEWKQKN